MGAKSSKASFNLKLDDDSEIPNGTCVKAKSPLRFLEYLFYGHNYGHGFYNPMLVLD